MDDCPNRVCSLVLRESLFPLRSRGSGGLPQPPGANTRTPFLFFLGGIPFQSCFAHPPPSLLALYCYSAIFFSSDGTSSKHHCQRIEQIVCSPNCDRVTRILRFLSKNFNLVPGVDQAYQDSHGIINYYLELIVNPAGKILVR